MTALTASELLEGFTPAELQLPVVIEWNDDHDDPHTFTLRTMIENNCEDEEVLDLLPGLLSGDTAQVGGGAAGLMRFWIDPAALEVFHAGSN